ncbi:hypothetical protein MBLNU13_g04115t2 [Cladosporium sp. NU13]
MSWQDIAATAQAYRDKTIAAIEPKLPEVPAHNVPNVTTLPAKLLSADVIEITELPTEALLNRIATGSLSSTQVTKAFLQRAGLAGKLVNCITEVLPDRALKRAADLDEYYATHSKPIGPLHGLPISVKEHIAMKGLDINAGFISWVGKVATDDGLILKLLWNAGCVFHARTTEPQTLMHLETSSNIYGVTVNPYNTNLTSGGSSGGEGALLGMRGSCLGIGTDIGGSIRSPAANQGLFGLKPTSYRLPLDGFAATMFGQEQIVPVIGPLSTSLEGIKIFMKTLIDQKPWLYEPSLVPMPWRESNKQTPTTTKPLRIGILLDDLIVKPHPPILRALETLTSKLANHPTIKLVPFPPHKHADAWRIISSLYFADGAAEELAAIKASSEPMRPLSDFIITDNPNLKSLSLAEVWKLTSEREAYKAEYARHWNAVGTEIPGPSSGEAVTVSSASQRDNIVDVLLCPVGPGCAPPLDCARYWGYTAQWNLLDYPALVFPTGLQCGPEDVREEGYEPRNEDDRYNYELYDPSKYIDAPISLQLVGRRYEEEKLIEALELITEVASLPFAKTTLNGNGKIANSPK